MELDRDEKEMILISLNMRLNYIQTGCVSLSPVDVSRMGADCAKRQYDAEIKPLSVDQMELIVKTDKLVKKILTS